MSRRSWPPSRLPPAIRYGSTMIAPLATFLIYDYPELRTVATTLLTVSGGLLAGGLLFAERFVALHEATGRLFRLGMIGLYAFAASGVCAGTALLGNFTDMVRLIRRYGHGTPDPAAVAAAIAQHDVANVLLLIASATLMPIGMLCLFAAADRRRAAREPTPTGASDPGR